ncbi:MAG TPA: peptidoglycan DD-metalloendopeptidase family protein [Candidatus Enterococcus avicola]|uniref:Peptidoglycan DD-metalloendopeptidase family protein n=1 Tax=Candidatus Enterococcus avicola TaxID=2838561 RepID=A0A9D2JI97_9ENTE|nr:peptidoglycan DD-metalloendopeptidase family protein [Candidatus Enterococcus avicola]
MKIKSILAIASLSLLFLLPQVAQANEMSQKVQEQTQKIEKLQKEVVTINDKQTAVKEEIEAFDTRAVTLENELATLHTEKTMGEEEVKIQENRLAALEKMALLQAYSQVTMVTDNSIENQEERIESVTEELALVEAKIAATMATIETEETTKIEKMAEQSSLAKSVEKMEAKIVKEEQTMERLKVEEAAAKKAVEKAEAEKKAEAARLERTGFISPLTRSYSISSGFGQRVDPTGYSGTGHDGIDMPGSAGEAILAARYGTVVEAGFHASAGNYAIVKHDNGYYTYYMHMTENFVSVGQTLETGQQIGTMGTTGNSTGVHLHFGIATGVWSGFVNPTSFI